MPSATKKSTPQWSRRDLLMSAAALAAMPAAAQQPSPTNFLLGCMTLPYSGYSFERAIEGIAKAGYKHVAWGTRHKASPSAKPADLIAIDAPPLEAKAKAEQCRALGLGPIMMFSNYYVGAKDSVAIHTKRLKQAAAAGIPQVLTFGEIKPGGYPQWIIDLKALGPVARDTGVLLVIKQHGGNTATGEDCAKIVREVGDEGVKMCYDAGNVLDYNNDDPIKDIETCWQEIRSFCIKDHRNWPQDQDCGPGFGEIDHYRLLSKVANTGLTMPLSFENIFEPLVERPKTPEGIDALARRAREYIESVIAGLQHPAKEG